MTEMTDITHINFHSEDLEIPPSPNKGMIGELKIVFPVISNLLLQLIITTAWTVKITFELCLTMN